MLKPLPIGTAVIRDIIQGGYRYTILQSEQSTIYGPNPLESSLTRALTVFGKVVGSMPSPLQDGIGCVSLPCSLMKAGVVQSVLRV